MKSVARWVALSGVIACLAGCASGPKYNDAVLELPAIPAGMERIWFYRTAVVGAAVQPNVYLNGEAVGTAAPKGFFFADRPPGDYTVTTTTELEKKLTFKLEKGQPRYVRLDISMGLFVGHVYPVLVDDNEAREELSSTSYIQAKAAK